MKVLFTKSALKKEVAKKIGDAFHYEFVDVIGIKHLKVQPFPLRNYSLIFTSVNGVKSFFENGFRPDENFTHPSHYNKIYAVGQKTKRELRKNGFGTFKVTRHASELSDFIIESAVSERFLHFCGNLALNILDKTLPLQNIWYKKLEVYETELLYPEIKGNYDAVCFFSPSGVRSFAKFNSLEGIQVFSIGETTEKELKKFTKNKIHTSKESNLDDLLQVIKNQLLVGGE